MKDFKRAAIGRASWKLLLIGIVLSLAMTSSAFASMVMTFDGGYTGDLTNGQPYSQYGMSATANNSALANIGDPLGKSFGGSNGTNGFYFDGDNAYVEFKLRNGEVFNLISFDLLTNGLAPRWITTSAFNGSPVWSGMPTTFTNLSFQSNQNFQGVEWVRVWTPHFGTQIDNVTFQSAPVPIPGAVWLLGSGLIGMVAVRRKLK